MGEKERTLKLEEIQELLLREHGIDITQIDDNKELLVKLIETKDPDQEKADIILAKLDENDEKYIRKMSESSNLIERIQDTIIRKLERKREKIRKTKDLHPETKNRILRKIEKDMNGIKILTRKSKRMIEETAKLIPILKRNKDNNTILQLIAGKSKDEELKEEQRIINNKTTEIIENLKHNKGE